MLAFRGTWGQGFRAPSIAESGVAGLAFGQGNTNDPVLCPNGVATSGDVERAVLVSGGRRPSEQPGLEGGEVAKRHLWRDLRALAAVQRLGGLVLHQADERHHLGGLGRRLLCRLDRVGAWTADQGGRVYGHGDHRHVRPDDRHHTRGLSVVYLVPYVNAGSTSTPGFDLDLKSRFDIGNFGSVRAELNYTYIAQYELVANGTVFDLAGTHGPQSISGDTGIRGSVRWLR